MQIAIITLIAGISFWLGILCATAFRALEIDKPLMWWERKHIRQWFYGSLVNALLGTIILILHLMA